MSQGAQNKRHNMIPTRITKDYNRGTKILQGGGLKNPFRRRSKIGLHPLEIHAPEAVHSILFVRVEFVLKSLNAPTPKRQDMPQEAYGALHGKSILIATSHPWFHQGHPDPEGVKLKILKSFCKKVQEKFPDTELLLFDDWLSCPQRPRTKKEDIVFYSCMDHMNEVYLYADMIVRSLSSNIT